MQNYEVRRQATSSYYRGQTHLKNVECRIYDNPDEMTEFLAEEFSDAARHRGNLGRFVESDGWFRDKDPDWYGGMNFNSFDEIHAQIQKTWAEGVETIENLIASISQTELPKPKSRKRRRRWADDSGDSIDLDRMRSGQSYWQQLKRQRTTAPQNITIVADVGTLAHYSGSQIMWRGAVAIALTKILEECGYRVELWAANYTDSVYRQYENPTEASTFQAVCLKRCQDSLEINSIASCISGWFYRTAIFGTRLCSPNRQSENMGTSCDMKPMLDLITHDKNPIVIENIWHKHDAETLLKSTLEKFVN